MTLNELVSQLYELSIAGFFNGQQFTLQGLKTYISSMFKGTLKLGSSFIIEIALPDGRWLMKITQYEPNRYDYIIPDTREQEARLYAELTA